MCAAGLRDVCKGAMPPPPLRPKPMRRTATAKILLNDSPTTFNESKPAAEPRTFGKFPRGALIWSSSGKPENVSSLAGNSMLGSRLDFSPLGVLSPSTPLGNLQTSKVGGGSLGEANLQSQQTSSSSPLINATNSEHKMKRVSVVETDTKSLCLFFDSYKVKRDRARSKSQ